jgi:hypothetical protein
VSRIKRAGRKDLIARHPLLQAFSRQRYMIEGETENAGVAQALID